MLRDRVLLALRKNDEGEAFPNRPSNYSREQGHEKEKLSQNA